MRDGTGPFLRTGDLGAMVDGDVYVCGRLKDLIIVRGRNLYPQDLETTARGAHPAVSQGSAAAVSISVAGAERLLLAVEVNRTARHANDPAEISTAIRRAIRDEYDVMVDRLELLMPGGIPNSSISEFLASRSRAQCHMARTWPRSLMVSGRGARTLG